MEELTTIKGLQYLVDESGERVAAVINLKEWGDLWEDFFDVLVSESRKDEPIIDWDTLKAEIEDEMYRIVFTNSAAKEFRGLTK